MCLCVYMCVRVWVSGLCVWPDSLGWSWPPAVAGVERVCKETAGGKANTSPVQMLGPARSDRFQNFPWSRVLARQACPDLHTWPTKSPESPLLSLCDEQVIYNPSVCVFLRVMGPGKENTMAVDLLCVALIKQSWEPSLLQITRGFKFVQTSTVENPTPQKTRTFTSFIKCSTKVFFFIFDLDDNVTGSHWRQTSRLQPGVPDLDGNIWNSALTNYVTHSSFVMLS